MLGISRHLLTDQTISASIYWWPVGHIYWWQRLRRNKNSFSSATHSWQKQYHQHQPHNTDKTRVHQQQTTDKPIHVIAQALNATHSHQECSTDKVVCSFVIALLTNFVTDKNYQQPSTDRLACIKQKLLLTISTHQQPSTDRYIDKQFFISNTQLTETVASTTQYWQDQGLSVISSKPLTDNFFVNTQ